MTIALYVGGTSAERDVSIISGKYIGEALEQLGNSVLYVDPALPPEEIGSALQEKSTIEETPPETNPKETGNHFNIFRLLLDARIAACDFHFIGLHGGIGENGLLQGMFEHLGYRFNGPGYSASAVAMNKHLSKQMMVSQDIPTPEWLYIEQSDWQASQQQVRAYIEEKFTPPVVIKPNSQGSTIGLTILSELDGLRQALEKAFTYDRQVIVEQYIPGSEMTAAVLGEEALPLIRIKPKSGLYDYTSKYSEGRTEYEVPAKVGDEVTTRMQQYALRFFHSLGATGYSRVDFRLTDADEPFCLELNTLPGMTATSLVPKAARAAGLSFEKLLEKIIELGRNT